MGEEAPLIVYESIFNLYQCYFNSGPAQTLKPAHSTPSTSQQAHNKHKHCHVFIAGIIDNRELTYNINLLDLPLKYGNIHFHFEHEVARG